MKEFMLCFLHENADAHEKALHDEMNGGVGCFSWVSKLQEKKQYITGHALHSAGVRISGKDRTVTDRAGSEIKELIGGFFLVHAKDLEEATKSVQENYWEFDSGSIVEIRETLVFEE